MRIGIDIDEVIADTLPAIIDFHNGTYGTTLRREDVFDYLGDVLGNSDDEIARKIHEFFDTDHFKGVSPIAGAYPALRTLKECGHELFVITARPERVGKQTQEWVETYFPGIFSGIYFGNRHGTGGIERKKSQLCAEHRIDILIEDDLHHATDCASHNINVLLVDQRWNQGEFASCIRRVFSWDDVLRMVS